MKSAVNAIGVTLSAIAIFLAGTAQADRLQDILSDRELTVGYITYDELTYRDSDTNEIKGFFPELLELIAEEMGIDSGDIEYVATDWSDFATGLQTGRYDFAIAGLFSTIPRATSAAFTDPIFYLGNSAMVLDGDDRFDDIENVMDLDQEDLTIAVVSGEQSHDFVRNNFENAEIEVVRSSDLTSAMLQVMSRRADVAMSDHFVVRKFVAQQDGTRDLFPDNPWNIQPITWAVRHEDQQLLTFLNNAIEYMVSTGQLQELMRDPRYEDVPFIRPVRELEPIN